MKPKAQIILNYGMMLNDVMGSIKDHLPLISRTIQTNKLIHDPDLIEVVGLFEEFLQTLKALDSELNDLAEIHLD